MRRLTLSSALAPALASALVLGFLSAPRPVTAQPSSLAAATDDEEADVRERRLAVQLFKEERFEESLQHWLRAYELAPLPRLHNNIAKCYQKLGRPRDELKHLELFHATDPDRSQAAEKHEAAERRITELRAQLGLDKKESTPVYKRWWFWTLLGTAAAGAAAGITAAVVVSGNRPADDGLPDPAIVRRSALSLSVYW